MKRVLTSLVIPATLSLAATPAFAAKSLLLEMRTEMDNVTYNNDAKASGSVPSTAFNFNTGRIDYKGDLSEDLSARVRLRFTNDNDTNRGVDSLTSQTDYAYLAHKMGDVTLMLGKYGSEVGGHETLTDSMLMYYKSEANKALTGTYTGLASSSTYFTPMKYVSGAKLTYKFGDSDASLMGFNNPNTDAVSGAKQSRFGAGASFRGKFMEKKLQPVLSYFSYRVNPSYQPSTTPAATGEGTNTALSAGLKWDDEMFAAQVDVINLESSEFNAADPTKMKLMTTVAEVTGKVGQWFPRVTLESSNVSETPETAAETKVTYTGFGLGTEFKPDTELPMRYFVFYNTKQAKTDGVDAKPVENHLLVGMSVSADLLK